MLKALRNRMQDDKGFTLIELMVVVLIIAILIAIAIPTFLGLRRRAQDRGAQSDLRNALTAAKAYYADDEAYTNATVANLGATEPSLTFLAAGTASASGNSFAVSVAVGGTNDQEFAAARMSASGSCFEIRDAAGPTRYASHTTAANCTGTHALTAAGTSW
jgi:type IV pilus assembly protein PilA